MQEVKMKEGVQDYIISGYAIYTYNILLTMTIEEIENFSSWFKN